MKRIRMILLCTISLVQAAKAADEVPPVAVAGLNAYRTNGLKAAYEICSKGSLEDDKASRDAAVSGLPQVESTYGRVSGYDVSRAVPIGSAVKRMYLVLFSEKGPVYAYIVCYKTGEKWCVTDLVLHTKANALFPASLLGG